MVSRVLREPSFPPTLETLLSGLIQFSDHLYILNYEQCRFALKDEKISLILKHYPDQAMQFLELLRILVSSCCYFYSIETDNLIESFKKMELLSINDDRDCLFKLNVKVQSTTMISAYTSSENFYQNNMKASFVLEKKPNEEPMPRRTFLETKEKESKKAEIDKNNMIIFIEEHMKYLKLMIQMLKDVSTCFEQLQLIYHKICRLDCNEYFNEDIYDVIIHKLECYVMVYTKQSYDYQDEFPYFRNTFAPAMGQFLEDAKTFLHLMKGYKGLVTLNSLTVMESMFIVKKNLDKVENKFTKCKKNIYEIKLYVFFIQFYLDNENKLQLLFTTFFENKKNALLMRLTEIPNALGDSTCKLENHIKSQILQKKFTANNSQESLLKMFVKRNICLDYFVLLFDKTTFFEKCKMDAKDVIYTKNCFDNLAFVDSDCDYGIITILHVDSRSLQGILNDVKNVVRNKSEQEKNGICVFRLTNYLLIGIKLAEKSMNDVNQVNNIISMLRTKFTDCHIIKTIIQNSLMSNKNNRGYNVSQGNINNNNINNINSSNSNTN